MGTIEQDLLECSNGCDSTKVTERKKCVDRLTTLLEDSRTVRLLNSKNNGNLTWDTLFCSVHRLILKEADRFRVEEQKAQSSTTSQSSRDNMKIKCASLIDNIVTKAVKGRGRLKCSSILSAISQVLSDRYLQKCFGCTYLLILKYVLTVRKYWGKIRYEDWCELLDVCFVMYEKPPPGLDKVTVAEILNRIVKSSLCQSHMGLHLRRKFPLLCRAFEDPNLHKLPALQASVLRLAILVSRELAKGNRMATCKFGEDVGKYVVDLYEHRLEDRYDKKGLMFGFLLLQMQFHHPGGAKEGDGAAYAYSWRKWQILLKLMYSLVDTEIHNIQRNKSKGQELSDNFLQFAVEVYKQVFEDQDNVLDVTNMLSLNETTSYSMPKRRRVVAGIQAITEVLNTSGKTQDIWPWLSVMSSLLSKYPKILKEQDFVPLLHVVAELQSTCKDSTVMGYLCLCCESLLKVEQVMVQARLNLKKINSLWMKVWETSLRTVGLNQSEESSHNLLQAMILHQKSHHPSTLINMFLNGTIRLSKHSLMTLQVILRCCDVPETLESLNNIPSRVRYQPATKVPESVRCVVLDWLLPNKEDVGLPDLNLVPYEPMLMSNVLVGLIVKTQHNLDDDDDDKCTSDDVKCVTNSIEDDYKLTSFDMGLLCDNYNEILKCNQVKNNGQSKLIVESARDKLLELLKRDCCLLTERIVVPPDNNTKLKIVKDYVSQCLLVSCTLSWMIKWNVIASYQLPTSSLTGFLRKMTAQLVPSATSLLVTSRMGTNLPVMLSVIQEIRQLFEVELHEDVVRLMQELTSLDLLDAVYGMTTMKQPQAGRSMDLPPASSKDDSDEEIMDTSDQSIIEEASCSLLDVQLLTEREKVHTEALGLLCSYSCSTGNKLSGHGTSALNQLLQLLLNDQQPTSSVCYFQMAVFVIRKVSTCQELEDGHVNSVMQVIQYLCKAHYPDHEAALIIHQLLRGMFIHIRDIRGKKFALLFVNAFQKKVDEKKYGVDTSVEYVKCLGELAKVDPNLLWATWNSGSPIDDEEVAECLPVTEELLIHIRNPFHEMRMTAASYISVLFSSQCGRGLNAKQQLDWQKRMFNKLCVIIMSSFFVENDLTTEEKVDEGANRTASALHCFGALIVVSSVWRRRALFGILQLVKEKNISTVLVHKVLILVGKSLKLPNIAKLIDANLNYILVHWRQQEYALQDFPWVLLNCKSDTEFFTKYQEVIVPILLQREEDESLELVSRKVGKSMAELVKTCYPRIIACFIPCFAADVSDGLKEAEVRIAKHLHMKLEGILTKETITYLLNSQLDMVIFNIMRLLFDPQHFVELFGVCRETLSDPDPPHFRISTILKSLLYLQENSPDPEVTLLAYLAKETPSRIQKILLCLAVDIYRAPTLEDKLKCLHCYATFSYALAKELSVKRDGLGDMTTFIVRDISHTLIHLIKQSYQLKEYPLAVAACHFYRLFCGKCFLSCASIIAKFLSVIVSILVPLAKLDGDLGAESRMLLTFLVVENSEHLALAIEMLDPFPGDKVFEDMQKVYNKIVQEKRMDTLEENIKHFLNAGNKNLGCRAEGLKHLRTQLSEKKLDLCMLYKELNDMRGFSEDCAKSLLHQLICMLVELTSVSDSKIRQEASRCLGELGPADLTTMILKPEKSQDFQENEFRNSPILLFTAYIVELLVGYLVDENIRVVEAASKALYVILASHEGQRVLSSRQFQKDLHLIPFKSERSKKRESSLIVNEDLFSTTVDVENLWCPLEECSHEKWITRLVRNILKTFPQENCFVSQLVPICNVKVSFAEQILPFLVSLVLCTNSIVCTDIVNRCICFFFRQHFETHLQLDKERSTSPLPVFKNCKEQVYFNRASVQCMLNVVHFARLQKWLKPNERNKDTNAQRLKLNYLHIAQAAQFCSAYFTSILYAELWCDDSRESNDTECGSLSALEYICDKSANDGVALQNILKEAYKKIGDNDAIYGCGSSYILDPQTRIRHHELTGSWQNMLLSCDLELSNGNEDAKGGMLYALKALGLYHLQNQYLCGDTYSEYEDYKYECGWRLGQWNLLSTENSRNSNDGRKTNVIIGLEKYHYLSLKALHDLDFTGVENFVTIARKCILDSLTHASLECSKNIYPALSDLQTLQEIEDFVVVCKSREGHVVEAVIDKWRKQSQLNLNEFQYIEPILAQRAVLLNNAMSMERNEQLRQKLGKYFAEIQLGTAKLARTEEWHHVGDRCLRMLSQVENLSSTIEGQLKLEDAQLSWARKNHDVGRRLLRSLLGELSLTGDGSQENRLLYASALTLYGNWMAETKSENSQAIVERYFIKAQRILEGVEYNEEKLLETYSSMARFADAQYQQLLSMLTSSVFDTKQRFMTKARAEANMLEKQKKRTRDEERKMGMCRKMSVIEEAEMKNRLNEKDMYLKLAMKSYLLSLEHGAHHNLQVFRLTSLWLENTAHEEVSEVLEQYLHRIPSCNFLPVLPQLAPRISNNLSDPFVRKLNTLLERCAAEHPHHTLPVILALANSYKDQDFTGGTQSERKTEPRVLGAQHMVQQLKTSERTKAVLTQMEVVATALVSLAYYNVENKSKSYPIQRTLLKQLKGNELVLVPTVTIPVKRNCNYDDIVGIYKYVDNFSLVGGVNAPKKIGCVGTDGIERPQLVKGKDDLRQDAVMQQVFTILNSLLQNNKETQKRKLLIRTYKVVPLSQRSGIIEWCENTQPLAIILIGPNGTHSRYYPKDLSALRCRNAMVEVAGKSNDEKLKTYNDICKSFHPAFHYFFLENFPISAVWFERRLAYIHSVATSSMIGYILGLGDRHAINILVDKSTAELIHIDFGIAFEQGHILPTPETVPFRLTRDIEDGMGVSGIEGVFRRCCEKTMYVLRQNQETILTILEVLLCDPLYAWTISPSKAYNIQQKTSKADLDYSDSEATAGEVNQMAERALVRLRQKLQGTEEGTATSIEGQVNRLLQQARDPRNLSRLYHGWQSYV